MPEEVKTEAPKEAPKSSGGSGLEPNIAAMLAYIFSLLGGIIFYVIEKDNKFVRFAAMQSILLSVVFIALNFVVTILTTMLAFTTFGLSILFLNLSWIVWLAFMVLSIMLAVNAYQNQEWELPVIGKIARNAVNK
jgi:uncharacterized membrane protein